MGKDRANKGTQQTRMDQYTAQNAGASLQKDPPGPLEKGVEPTGGQTLAATESTGWATQTQIAAIAVDVSLLRADLRVVAERSVATEQQVTCMQSDVDTLKASVAILEAKTSKLKVLHAGRSHFFQSPEAAWDWLERNDGTGTPESLRGRVVGDSKRQRKCLLQRVEVPDAIVPAMEGE
ncbi:hypothetical protein NDU88_000954 [Pleurodeles waltl]|uniref:Uncharacterized protein n=1 Tax=Pleurodeles waltl TaxID=8319 RepID=A0AAV7P592_PLEWA|nr:hypothetical protein NDU88_000954 [Pleurodeles waltl]